MAEKKLKVLLEKPATYKGVSYQAGEQELPEAAASAAVRKGLGKIIGGGNKKAGFKPLSVEETMKRFEAGDSSDEVFESLRFHQAAIVGAGKGEQRSAAKEPAGLPEDFPMKHVFESFGFKSVAEVHAKTRDELIALKGIAEKTADAALSYGK